MQHARDWITALNKSTSPEVESTVTREAPPQSPEIPGAVDFFILRSKWDEMPEVVFLGNTARALITGPWMVRITSGDTKSYLCGNEAVWHKLEGKDRYWIHDILARLWEHTVASGLSKGKFWSSSLSHLLGLMRSQKILGGTFEE